MHNANFKNTHYPPLVLYLPDSGRSVKVVGAELGCPPIRGLMPDAELAQRRGEGFGIRLIPHLEGVEVRAHHEQELV